MAGDTPGESETRASAGEKRSWENGTTHLSTTSATRPSGTNALGGNGNRDSLGRGGGRRHQLWASGSFRR